MIFKGQLQTYQNVKFLGKGVQSMAYQVKGLNDNQYYCLKKIELPNFRYKEEEFVNKRIANKSQSNLLQIYEWWQDECTVYQIQEFCNGGDLSQLLKKQRILDVKEIEKIISDIGKQLGQLHKMNFVHQDLKPENIVIQNHAQQNQNNEYKLCDFGGVIQGKFDGDGDYIQSRINTPCYQAPETLLKYLNQTLTFAVDIWSFGVIIYELISGKKLFDEQDIYTTLRKIESYIRDQTEIHEKIDCLKTNKELKNFLKAMLNPIPEYRPTLEEVIQYFKNNFLYQMNVEQKNRAQNFKDKCQEQEEEIKQLKYFNGLLIDQLKNCLINLQSSKVPPLLFTNQDAQIQQLFQDDNEMSEQAEMFLRSFHKQKQQQQQYEQQIKGLEVKIKKLNEELQVTKNSKIVSQTQTTTETTQQEYVTQSLDLRDKEIKDNQLKHYKKELNEVQKKNEMLMSESIQYQEKINQQNLEIKKFRETIAVQRAHENYFENAIQEYKQNEKELYKCNKDLQNIIQNLEKKIYKLQEELDLSKQRSFDEELVQTKRKKDQDVVPLIQVNMILDEIGQIHQIDMSNIKEEMKQMVKFAQSPQNQPMNYRPLNTNNQVEYCQFCHSCESIFRQLSEQKYSLQKGIQGFDSSQQFTIEADLSKFENAHKTLIELIDKYQNSLRETRSAFPRQRQQSKITLPKLNKKI